jgi:CheY-like chemotaxis protein
MCNELSLVFERAYAERLAHAERLLRWMAGIYRAALTGMDLAYHGPQRTLLAAMRFREDGLRATDLQRIRFWVSRAGGRVRAPAELTPAEWEELRATCWHADVRAIGVDPADAVRTIGSIATAAGLDASRRSYADDRPSLTLDIRGPGWEAVRWSDAEETLFVAAPIAPPLGDAIPILFRTRGTCRAALEWARVVAVRAPEDAQPGRPAGFALGLSTSPRELRREISRSAPTAEYGTRAAPRFAFRRPLEASVRLLGLAADDPSGRCRGGWVENLSLGGAFVRLSPSMPAGSEIELSFQPPGVGRRLVVRAQVAFADPRGIGVRFRLDAASMAVLHDLLTRLPAHPRRALLIDDDDLVRKMIADALVERGFDVLTAGDGREGLRVLAEELLSLDLLITDHFLPGTLGEELVATIRSLGGESDLLIAVITGTPDARLAERLREAGADVLLGKELGPEIIAMKVDALLEARLTGQPLRSGWGPARAAPERSAEVELGVAP